MRTKGRHVDNLCVPFKYAFYIILGFIGRRTYLDDKNSSQNFPVTISRFRTWATIVTIFLIQKLIICIGISSLSHRRNTAYGELSPRDDNKKIWILGSRFNQVPQVFVLFNSTQYMPFLLRAFNRKLSWLVGIFTQYINYIHSQNTFYRPQYYVNQIKYENISSQ